MRTEKAIRFRLADHREDLEDNRADLKLAVAAQNQTLIARLQQERRDTHALLELLQWVLED